MNEGEKMEQEIITVSPAYRWLTIVFAATSLIVAAIILLSTLSKSTIIITPKYQDKEIPFSLAIYKNAEDASDKQAGLLADITETNMEKDIKVSWPDVVSTSTRAHGVVEIVNNSNKQQVLIVNTQLRASNEKIYRLDKTITCPAKSKITVALTADQDGPGYDIGKDKLIIVKLRTDLQPLIYGLTEKIDREQITSTTIDEAAVEKAMLDAKKQLGQELMAELKKQKTINEKTLQIDFYRQTLNTNATTTVKEIVFTLGASARALAISDQDLADAIASNLPPEFANKIVLVDSKLINYKIDYQTNSEKQLAFISGQVKLKVASININKNELVGLTIDQAKNRLLSEGAENVEIKQFFWQRHLPRWSNNINLEIKKL
jgi:hypothetical protein